ncbi:VWA domain-containing protein [Candidatus Chloroploca asiatica]|uniref:VWA domain-containing protein n=2 Tax=Candidatus Chloroploca asiatica TaxID=1506545 RepID=A0A2H3KZF0_9CHLR|nr:VWA domain-containing protein [Candidatus Chloroploca asiatica]
MADAVTLTCTWGRAPLPVTGTPQVAYLLVEATPATQPSVPVPLNFCFVLDRSGSMQGAKLESMKAATSRVIETLTPADVVSIVIFDDTVQTLVPATPATDPAALLAAVNTITESGGTAMSLGLQAGQAELQKYLGPDRLSYLVLLTDGQTWGDEDLCRTLANDLGQAGVRITALGLGVEWNEKLLDDLADATGGVSDYIAEPAQIATFFQRALRSAQGTAATDARLLLRLVKEVVPRAVHRATPTIANLGYQPIGESEVAVKLGDLVHGQVNSVVLDLMVPVRSAGTFRIAQAELHATLPGASGPEVVKQDLLLSFTTEAAAPVYDPRVMNLVEKVTAFKLQTRALAEAELGNLSGATQKLRAAATRLLDLGELDLAAKTTAQADQLEQGSGLSAEGQKELRYATRRLTQKLDEADV